MIFTETPITGCYVINIQPIGDDRGWFLRTFCKKEFSKISHSEEWVQLNHSYTSQKGTIRGMHFQTHPYSETKLVRCISGRIYDVVVDLRRDSKTFLSWFGVEISASNRKMIYIPKGLAHGFQTLSDNTELIYHHTEFYTPNSEAGIRFDDPTIKIKWPLLVTEISDRDHQHPSLDINFKGI